MLNQTHLTPDSDGNPLETITRGEQLLERMKSVSQRITERVRLIIPDDTKTDTGPLPPDAGPSAASQG